MAKLVEVKEKKKTSSKPKIDLSKIKDIIDDNPEAVNKIKEGVTDLLTSKLGEAVSGKKTTKKTTSKKKTTKSSTKKNNSDGLSKVLDIAGSFLKK